MNPITKIKYNKIFNLKNKISYYDMTVSEIKKIIRVAAVHHR